MDERLKSWRPSRDELDQILSEMRPVIREVAKKARRLAQAQSG